MKTISIIAVTVLFMALSFSANELVAKSFLKPVVSVCGKILDDTQDLGLGLSIYIRNDNGKIIGIAKSNKLDGSYFITGLKPGTSYELVFKVDKRTIKTMQIATPLTNEYLEIEQNFFVKLKYSDLQTLNK